MVANALLAVAAYRELLRFDFGADVTHELEGFFFVPSDANPLVVVGLAAWLLFRRAGRLRALPDARDPASLAAGLALAAAGAGVAVWSTLTAVPDLLAVSAGCNGLAWAFLCKGRSGARAVLLPALFLLFALPIPAPLLNELAFRLQLWTSQYSAWILHAAGMPALVSADQIHRLEASFAVVENCSGLRSMETLTLLAVLMVDLFQRRGGHALALLAAAPPVAFALNGLRVVTLILNPHSDVASVHTLQGVAMLLGGLALLYLLDGLLARWLSRGAPALGAPGAADRGAPGRPGARRWLPSAALAASGLATLLVSPWPEPTLAPVGLRLQIPPTLRGWSSRDLEIDTTFLGTIAMRQSILREYANGHARVVLYVGLGNHSRGTRGPFSPKTRVPGSGWVGEWSGVAGWGGRPSQALELRAFRKGAQRQLVGHWVEGDAGRALESARWLLGLERSPWRRRGDGLVVRLGTDLEGPGEAARERAEATLERFFRLLRPPLGRIRRALERG